MDAWVLRKIRFYYLPTCSSLVLLALLLFHVSGCSAVKRAQDPALVCAVPSALGNAGRVSFFLNLQRPDVPHLNLKITAVEIFNSEMWVPVSLATKEIDTEKIGRGQISLGNLALDPGKYEAVRLVLAPDATIVSQGKESALVLEELEVEIPFTVPLELRNETSEAIFLAWDVESSISAKKLGPLVISLTTSRLSPIISNQIYVACPDINTIYVVREDKKWVDNSFFLAGRPTYLVVDGARQRLFVLCQDDGDIKVVDLLTNSLVDIIALPMTFHPTFMSASADLSKAYVIDDLGTLSVIDLRAGSVIARKRIGQRPSYVAHLSATKTVAVSSSMDSMVYLLDETTLEITDQIKVNGGPAGIVKKDDFLYIAEEQANSITIFDYNLRSKLKSLFVGYAPRRLAGLGGNVYVANAESGSVSLVRTQNNRVSREIPVGNKVYEMAASEKEHVVYIGKNVKEDCGGSISVLGVNANDVIGEIEIGARPWGIAVAGNGL
jgi:YVTN family beta-propeller protein